MKQGSGHCRSTYIFAVHDIFQDHTDKRRRSTTSWAKLKWDSRVALPVIFAVFCLSFVIAVMSSGHDDPAGNLQRFTVAPMKERVYNLL